jgi:hypothetical protein
MRWDPRSRGCSESQASYRPLRTTSPIAPLLTTGPIAPYESQALSPLGGIGRCHHKQRVFVAPHVCLPTLLPAASATKRSLTLELVAEVLPPTLRSVHGWDCTARWWCWCRRYRSWLRRWGHGGWHNRCRCWRRRCRCDRALTRFIEQEVGGLSMRIRDAHDLPLVGRLGELLVQLGWVHSVGSRKYLQRDTSDVGGGHRGTGNGTCGGRV